jgi:hypothetical protein
MSQFLELIKALVPRCHSQKEIDETYLGNSVDINDLERRMQEIESRKSSDWSSHLLLQMSAQ